MPWSTSLRCADCLETTTLCAPASTDPETPRCDEVCAPVLKSHSLENCRCWSMWPLESTASGTPGTCPNPQKPFSGGDSDVASPVSACVAAKTQSAPARMMATMRLPETSASAFGTACSYPTWTRPSVEYASPARRNNSSSSSPFSSAASPACAVARRFFADTACGGTLGRKQTRRKPPPEFSTTAQRTSCSPCVSSECQPHESNPFR
mmetsp:Transcript_11601/g.38772  ORF Transcript_11601/g.38772 Transcript_11601/m.38772 type:complete len:208 (-) Transcript_11601:523-1146(-)